MIEFGLCRVAARNHVHQALRNLFKLGLLEVDWGLSKTNSEVGFPKWNSAYERHPKPRLGNGCLKGSYCSRIPVC